jgi:hypothetical protein
MKKFFWNKWILILLILALAVPVYLFQGDRKKINENQDYLKTILKLKELPATVNNIDCEKWGQSGLLITCYFEYDNSKIDELMSGRDFQFIENASGSSHDDSISGGPARGIEFKVAHGWIVKSSEFGESGWVRFHTDSSKSKAITDIYIE